MSCCCRRPLTIEIPEPVNYCEWCDGDLDTCVGYDLYILGYEDKRPRNYHVGQCCLDKDALVARSLTLGERRFLFVQPSRAAERGDGWLIEYAHVENGPPRVWLLDRDELSRAIAANDATGSFAPSGAGGWFAWLRKGDPLLDLDAEQTRRWLPTRKEADDGSAQSLGKGLWALVAGKAPFNAVIDPQADLALEPERCDPRLLGVSVFRKSEVEGGCYTVQATDDPAVLLWSMDDPDFGQPKELMATEIDGVTYLTATDAGDTADGESEYLIFRYEFVDDDTLVLVPADGDRLERAVKAKELSGKVKTRRRWSDDSAFFVTASTEELRAFVSEHGAECFPDRLIAPLVCNFKRLPANSR